VVVYYVGYCWHYCTDWFYHYDYDCGCYYYPFSSTPYYWDGYYGTYYYWGDECGCYYYPDGSYYYSYWDYECGCHYYWYSTQKMYYYWDEDCGCHKWGSKLPPKKKPDHKPGDNYCPPGAQTFLPCDDEPQENSKDSAEQSKDTSSSAAAPASKDTSSPEGSTK
jgi:hypothetical protein